ncbi:MAG: TetR/AcrR family transcriptional regulator [Aliishimia sp.]
MNTHPTDLVPPAGPKGRKVEQVLAGAHEVFMAEGYEGANVDAIAKAAGVSKATLYSYFADKRVLFAAVAQAACEEQTRLALSFADEDGDFAEQLYKGCRSFMSFMYSPFGVQMFRTVVAESARFPEFGRQFWATGPGMAHAEMVKLFKIAAEEGLLDIDDFELAAETLTELCKVYVHPRLIMRVIDSVEEVDLDRIAHHAVETFMARYGV